MEKQLTQLGDEFTMAEYIEANGLNVSIHDSGSTRMIAAHLRKKGFKLRRKRRNGEPSQVWTKDKKRKRLMDKLEEL